MLSPSADVEAAAVPQSERTVVQMRGIRKSFGPNISGGQSSSTGNNSSNTNNSPTTGINVG